MAKTDFIQGAVKRPGAATEAAEREGLSVHEWALKHQHDPGVTGRRARLALTFEGMARSKRVSDTKKTAKVAAAKKPGRIGGDSY